MTDTWATSTNRPEADTQPSEPTEEYTVIAPAHTPATTLSGVTLSSKGFFRRMLRVTTYGHAWRNWR
jgi:hypothetical protein